MGGRADEPNPAVVLSLPQFVDHAAFAKDHLGIVARVNVLDEEGVDDVDAKEAGQLSPSRPQSQVRRLPLPVATMI